MIPRLSKFCRSFPWVVIGIVILLTAGAVNQITSKLYFEGDLSKFLPKNLSGVKANDYFEKNFNYQEGVLIGVEAQKGTLMEPKNIRTIEEIVLALKSMKLNKTFHSYLTGKEESLDLPLGFDTEDITSIANLEDAILDKETGAVNTGSVIEKLKKTYRIPFSLEDAERLPKSDIDLEKIIPSLAERAMKDPLFKGSRLSEDFKSGSIQVPMVRKIDVKKSYIKREISTAIDPEKLKARFQQKDTFFPFAVYGKTINGVTYDDAFLKSHAADVKRKIHGWLFDYLEEGFEKDAVLEGFLTGELTPEKFDGLMRHFEGKNTFMNPGLNSWETFFNNYYAKVLKVIDPLSRENLEFKLYNPKEVYDLAAVYDAVMEVLAPYQSDEIRLYTAGQPVVFALLSHMMSEDMKRMLPIAVVVILVILGISFRSVRGVVIPLVTVIISIIWSLGSMAYADAPLSVTTSVLPIVLLAVGTAYGIHFLNAYYEAYAKTKSNHDAVLQMSIRVGVAVVMAALTTVAGFGSLGFSALSAIADFGIYSALGVGYALLLTLTLTPAILTIWPAPKRGMITHVEVSETEDLKGFHKLLAGIAKGVMKHPKYILTGTVIIFGTAVVLTFQNYFEGNSILYFKTDNEIRQSDQFLNKHLTGTTPFSFIFKLRDHVNLESDEAQSILSNRLSLFSKEWKKVGETLPEVATSKSFQFDEKLSALQQDILQNQAEIESNINLLKDIFNEDFSIEAVAEKSAADELDSASESGLDEMGESDDLSLEGMGDMEEEDDSEEAESEFSELDAEVIAGLKDINIRLGMGEDRWQETGAMVLKIREEIKGKTLLSVRKSFNYLQDFFDVTVKQPLMLVKVKSLYDQIKQLKTPELIVDGEVHSPTGFMATPVDHVRKLYRTFYHDDDYAFDRLPSADKDGFSNTDLTDRSLTAVSLNQALNSDRDSYEAIISPNGKEFTIQVFIRNGDSANIRAFSDVAYKIIEKEFPKNDPYVGDILVGGSGPTTVEVTDLIVMSQTQSIVMSFALVLCVTFFIFRSLIGGIFSLIPLAFTVILNFAVIYLMGEAITTGTVMVASIAIGTGIDYTIHFLERYKSHIQLGDDYNKAYYHTVISVGRAILLNALSVALGFLVLLFSEFATNINLGILMACTMVFSSIGALVILPALILVTKPKFVYGKKKQIENSVELNQNVV